MIIWSEIQTFIGMVIVLMHLTTATSENDTGKSSYSTVFLI